jgi:hypothetical protein
MHKPVSNVTYAPASKPEQSRKTVKNVFMNRFWPISDLSPHSPVERDKDSFPLERSGSIVNRPMIIISLRETRKDDIPSVSLTLQDLTETLVMFSIAKKK